MCPFSSVTSSGKVRRKVPESEALCVPRLLPNDPYGEINLKQNEAQSARAESTYKRVHQKEGCRKPVLGV